ncbi:hypothetical protein [Ruminococcus sp.]|uniref:hypothetical protein n=1 Tax=Ruminococcus sp. TaxID=41978 RepID=UPI0025EC15E7|nr:hypothetical protein [Ruminococcus sp.]MBQ9541112.1 hypothetical protein [Ruminococcus sp.]
MFFDKPFWKKQLDSNEKLLWYGRPAVFFSHWGVPVWILMIPAVFFSAVIIGSHGLREPVMLLQLWGGLAGFWAVLSLPMMASGGLTRKFALTDKRLLVYDKGIIVTDLPLDKLMSVRLTDQACDPSPLDDMGPKEMHNYLAMTLYEANRRFAESMGKDPESIPKPEMLPTDYDTPPEHREGYFNIVRAEFFSGRVIFLACNRYRRLFRLLDSTKKYLSADVDIQQ